MGVFILGRQRVLHLLSTTGAIWEDRKKVFCPEKSGKNKCRRAVKPRAMRAGTGRVFLAVFSKNGTPSVGR
jgi:hypothetical protein